MATFAEIRQERKKALSSVRRTQRQLDSQVEVMERTIFRLLDRKRVLTADDALRLAQIWDHTLDQARAVEKALADFYTVVRT